MSRFVRSLLLLLLAAAPAGAGAAEPDACAGRETSVLIRVAEHALFQCDAGKTIARRKVALGKGGVGKKRVGDNKTPLGAYALGAPRTSTRFGLFIPVGYPTADQRAQGFTGRDVGIHGPARAFRWAGNANLWLDWTQGCIALASDAEIQELARWVEEKKPQRVFLE